MRSGSKRRWMSRLGNGRCLARAAGYGRCCRFSLSTTTCRVYSGLRPGGGSEVREKRQQDAVGTKHPHELIGQRLRRFLIKVVEHVPAQDAVDTARLLREPLHQERRKLVEKTVTDVTVDVLRKIFDDDLAAQLLAKETDVGADDRTKVEEDRLRARA